MLPVGLSGRDGTPRQTVIRCLTADEKEDEAQRRLTEQLLNFTLRNEGEKVLYRSGEQGESGEEDESTADLRAELAALKSCEGAPRPRTATIETLQLMENEPQLTIVSCPAGRIKLQPLHAVRGGSNTGPTVHPNLKLSAEINGMMIGLDLSSTRKYTLYGVLPLFFIIMLFEHFYD